VKEIFVSKRVFKLKKAQKPLKELIKMDAPIQEDFRGGTFVCCE
jgi:hypothetical protein